MSETPSPNMPASEVRKNVAWMPGAEVEVCPACKRSFLVPTKRSKQPCPLCYQAQLAAQQSYVRPEAPEIVLPAQLTSDSLQRVLTKFVDGVPYRAPDLSVENLMNRAQLVWWPFWLVDADLEGDWTGTMGFDYQVQTAKESFGDQGWQSKQTLRTQTRYEARRGALKRHYDNIQVPALRLHQKRLDQIGKYDQKKEVYHHAGIVSQNYVQLPEIEPQELLEVAQTRLHSAAEQEIMQASAAQHRQNVKFSGKYLNFNWTQYLLPLITTFYHDEEGHPHPVILNGQTGKVYGKRLASVRKATQWTLGLMALPVLLLLAALLIFLIAPASLPIDLACGGMILFILAILALLPLLRAHHWNGRENNSVEDFN